MLILYDVNVCFQAHKKQADALIFHAKKYSKQNFEEVM